MERLDAVIDPLREVQVRERVVAVFQVEQKVRQDKDLMVAEHVAECHQRGSLNAVKGVVARIAVHDIGREVQLVLVDFVIARGIDVVSHDHVLCRIDPLRRVPEGVVEYVVPQVDLHILSVEPG